MVENILHIITFSLQFAGLILLVDRFIGFSKKKIVYKHLSTSLNYLQMKNGKTIMEKNNYINIMKIMISSLYATFYTLIGFALTLFNFKCNLNNIDKIHYALKILLILFIIKYITEKIVIFVYNKKYKDLKEVEISIDETPEGASSFEIFEIEEDI